jgi:hypothetical protein
MENEAPSYRAASVMLASAVILVVTAVIMANGDPEVMSLRVLAATIIIAIAYAVTNRHSASHRIAVGMALTATFILFWMIGAVGIMGTDDQHPADVMYIAVFVVGTIGAIIARFQPEGMVRVMLATAVVQMLVPVMVLIAGLNLVSISTRELLTFTLMVNGPFAVLYVGSAVQFRKAASRRGRVGAAHEATANGHVG